LYILAITYLFSAIGLAAGSPSAANGYGFILLFLPYVSSAFVPVDTMPEWLRWLAENQPLTPIIETIRNLLLGTDSANSALAAVGWCTLILMIAVLWGRRCSAARLGAANAPASASPQRVSLCGDDQLAPRVSSCSTARRLQLDTERSSAAERVRTSLRRSSGNRTGTGSLSLAFRRTGGRAIGRSGARIRRAESLACENTCPVG
jgi:hypothetical protein